MCISSVAFRYCKFLLVFDEVVRSNGKVRYSMASCSTVDKVVKVKETVPKLINNKEIYCKGSNKL